MGPDPDPDPDPISNRVKERVGPHPGFFEDKWVILSSI